jgi:hypothetical protein
MLASCCFLFAICTGCDDAFLGPHSGSALADPDRTGAPAFVLALAGRGDLLAAGLDGGVVLWDLSSGSTRSVNRLDGLPSDHVGALALDERAEALLAATRAGLACGWWEGDWVSALSGLEPCDHAFGACSNRPGGGWVAGSANGLLAAWTTSRLDTLRLPRRSRIVALTHARGLLEPGSARDSDPTLVDAPLPEVIAPGLVPGLVVATDTDGVWILRSSGSAVRWLQLGVRDGLPAARMRAVVADDLDRAWLATDAGAACVGPGIAVHTWPADSLLGRPARSLLCAPDGWIYVGLDIGVVRIDARTEFVANDPVVERVPGIGGRVLALAWADGTLWWTDGIRVRSLNGLVLDPPTPLPGTVCPIWIGRTTRDLRGVPAPRSRTGLRVALARCVRGTRPSLPEPGRSRTRNSPSSRDRAPVLHSVDHAGGKAP